jgi:hypothetical protein
MAEPDVETATEGAGGLGCSDVAQPAARNAVDRATASVLRAEINFTMDVSLNIRNAR